ncbi:MAG: endonuclease/exonuclease/phosphatase family protein [Bacteroidales bacterium]|nr:endonuclease/exonuclease/phosphatase family protein [Bacteroidales bacterium]
MTKTVLFLISFIALCFLCYSQEKKVNVYGVAFYNLENLFDTINNNGNYDLEFSPQGDKQWNGAKYNSKLKNMASVFKEMAGKFIPQGPAVYGVVELENRSVLEDLVNQKSIKEWHLQIVHYDSPDKRGVDVALIYNPRLFKVLSSATHNLYLSKNPNFRTRDQLVVTGLLGGAKVSVIVNHWPSRLGGESSSSYLREAAASLTKHIADSLFRDDPNGGIIIMGDFNDDPTNKSLKEVLGGRKEISQTEKSDFYNTVWPIFDRGIGSLAYNGSWNMFDQILISNNLLGKDENDPLKFWKAEVFNKPFLTTEEGEYKGYPKRTFSSGVFINGYSDHYPVLIYLTKRAD